MARPRRLIMPGMALHVTQRGNNRTPVFLDKADYRRFWDLLLWASKRHGCAVHAYVFMTNHMHLLLTPTSHDGPAKMMQAVGRLYVPYFNSRYRRTGTLWEGRYRSAVVDSDRYFWACTRYIELNPVRAHMVTDPGEHPWSSYHRNAAGGTDALVAHHALYWAMGSCPADREAAHRALLAQTSDATSIEAIREATRRGNAVSSWGQSI